MSQYKYATVLEAQSDGKPPNDNIEKGDKILKAGKHDKDIMKYLTEDKDIEALVFRAVEVYESETRMSEGEAERFGKDKWFSEQEA